MFLDSLIRTLRAPLDFVRSKVWGVTSFKGRLRGDLDRMRDLGQQYRGAVGAVGRAGQSGAGGGAQAPQPRKKKAKMGLFSKKKKCPSCGEKLHLSWDQCPYCGASAGAAPS